MSESGVKQGDKEIAEFRDKLEEGRNETIEDALRHPPVGGQPWGQRTFALRTSLKVRCPLDPDFLEEILSADGILAKR
jgi:hypothetical protein